MLLKVSAGKMATKAGVDSKSGYLESAEHPRHLAKAIGETYSSNCKFEEFSSLAEAGHAAYREDSKSRVGRPCKGMITEEIIASTMVGETLSVSERRLVFDIIVKFLAVNCWAVGVWHLDEDSKKKRFDLHVLIASVLPYGEPTLRKTWLGQGGATNYRARVKSLEDIIVNEINLGRMRENLPLYPTKAELRELRQHGKDYSSLPVQIAEWLGNDASAIDGNAIGKALLQRGWGVQNVKHKQLLMLRPPQGYWGVKKPDPKKAYKKGRDPREPKPFEYWWLVCRVRNAADDYQRKRELEEEEKRAKVKGAGPDLAKREGTQKEAFPQKPTIERVEKDERKMDM